MTGKSGPDIQLADSKGLGRMIPELSNYHPHGSFYTHDNGLTVSLPTLDTPVVSTGWTVNLQTGAPYVVVDATNGTITIGDNGAGLYNISVGVSFQSDKNNILVHAAAFLNGAKILTVSSERSIGTANATGYFADSDHVLLAAGDVLDYRFEADANTVVIAVNHGGMNVMKIAGEV